MSNLVLSKEGEGYTKTSLWISILALIISIIILFLDKIV